ncbi:MAG: hypothetical protein AUI36_13910 [Cyanobacteria bacterium 13_1_40CM_2_61_4]|nr:MAG: hypothetical protein AUI36_13910 [Cyanobacteria bacterium 13_1_40CM_2_61_4]
MNADRSKSEHAWLQNNLVCPRDGAPLIQTQDQLSCGQDHDYPIIEGIPILLMNEVPQTLSVANASLGQRQEGGDPYRITTLGLSDAEKEELEEALRHKVFARIDSIDPVVSFLVGATNGIAYRHLIGKLAKYPIPKLRLPPGNGQVFLDVGCNWGRWSIAAAQNGYLAIGLDPSLGAVLAAKRVADKLGLSACFIVADARFLPFRSGCANVAFSYSVLQHFSRSDAEHAITEMGRVLHPGGRTYVQMPTVFGVRCIYHQLRRRFREAQGFEVRYWTIPALRRVFANKIGPTSVSVDCYFGIGLQASDRHLMPFTRKLAINGSELLRKVARMIPGVSYLADSVYVESIRRSSQ